MEKEQALARLNDEKAKAVATSDELAGLIENANAPIIRVDRDLKITGWNTRTATLTGFSKEDALSQNLVEKFIDEGSQANAPFAARAMCKFDTVSGNKFTRLKSILREVCKTVAPRIGATVSTLRQNMTLSYSHYSPSQQLKLVAGRVSCGSTNSSNALNKNNDRLAQENILTKYSRAGPFFAVF